jgi:lipoprotein-releasing system permease protein
VMKIGVIAFLLSSLATLYPSYRGAKVRPAEALRYE